MIIIGGFILGATIGAVLARKRGGKGLDILHYAAGFGIAFAILGTFATVWISRTLI